ncbi:MAG: hypothetical protein AAGH89_17930, partial [Verrucomicrobiota bacterium]
MIAFVSRQFQTALSKDPLFFAAIYAVFGIGLAHLIPLHSLVWWSIAAALTGTIIWRPNLRPLFLLSVLLGFGGLQQFQQLDSSQMDTFWDRLAPSDSIPVSVT